LTPITSINHHDQSYKIRVQKSEKVGKDFLKWENDGGLYYTIFGEDVVESVP